MVLTLIAPHMNILKAVLLLITPFTVFANEQYTESEVLEHNTPDDCWVVFEDGVYDLSVYLPDHDKFMDIREWCGLDMTEDFKTKADAGRDHKPFSYALLEDYYIGELVEERSEDVVEESISEYEVGEPVITETTNTRKEMPYNLFVPLLITLAVYWGSYFMFKKKNILKFNGFWNTLLLLTFLIPSFGFGIFMMLRYRFTELREIEFDFMYWHVELSVVMGAIALSHFIQRFKQYLVQLRK
jgi:cytochrome b involved in lipid metabolism